MSGEAQSFDAAAYEAEIFREHERGGIRITSHAVERFIQRWAPGAERDAAREALLDLVEQATPLREKTVNGHELWGALDVRFVVKRDAPRRGRAGGPIVVTVLPAPPRERHEVEFDEFMSWWEEEVAYRRSQGTPTPGVAPDDPDLAAQRAKKRGPDIAREDAERTRAWSEHNPRSVALVAKAKSDHRRACEDEVLARDLRALADDIARDAKNRKHEAREAIERATKGET